jgi:hypothetical protein
MMCVVSGTVVPLLVLALYSFVLQLLEDGALVPKHVGVLILIMDCILVSAFVGGGIDFIDYLVIRLFDFRYTRFFFDGRI